MNKKFSKTGLIVLFIKGSLSFFVLSVISALFLTLLDLFQPQIVRYVIDCVIDNKASSLPNIINNWVTALGGIEFLKSHLWLPALCMAVIALISAAFKYLNALYNAVAAETMVKSMRDKLFNHIQHLPYSWHMQNQTGDMIQRCTSDVEVIKNFVSEQLTSVFRIVLLLILSLSFMFTMNVKLSMLALISFPLIILFSAFFQGKISSSFTKCDENEGLLSTIAQENLTGVRVVRAFGRESYEKEKFEKQNNVYTDFWMKLCKWLALFWASSDFISAAQVMLMIVVGSSICVNGEMTPGELIAFISYNAMLVWPVRRLGRLVADMSKSGVSLSRIAYIMNSEIESEPENALTPPMNSDIKFQNVSFSYLKDSEDILKDVSFTIKKGSTFGILGGTGTGKSTLTYLLTKLYSLDENSGRILIGDTDIKDISTDYLRKNIGMVMQEPFLFSRTISENISITEKSMPHERIRSAARVACVDDAITEFSDGYDTMVGERGVTLSGGQKQRVAIARMLALSTPIMVFDDSLSAVDAETDAKIRKALSEILKGSTVILISHRITTLMDCDDIIVLDKGRVAEEGTHSELIEKGGIYKEIYAIQSDCGEEAI